MHRLLFLLLLGFCQPSAFAAIYKCEGADGKLAYQGSPCDKGDKLTLPPGTAAPAATPPAKANAVLNAPKSGNRAPAGEKQCVGKELRIRFQNMPVLTMLHVLADFSGNRLVADPSIAASGAFYYDCTSWETVLQDVASKYQLSAKVAGGVITVTKR